MLRSFNETYNRSIRCSPFEFVYKQSNLYPLRKDLEINMDQKKEEMIRESERRREVMNSKSATFSFETGQQVLIKKPKPGKVEDKLEGPFRIVEVDNARNRAKVDLGEKTVWDNVRRLVPFRCERLQDVARPLGERVI